VSPRLSRTGRQQAEVITATLNSTPMATRITQPFLASRARHPAGFPRMSLRWSQGHTSLQGSTIPSSIPTAGILRITTRAETRCCSAQTASTGSIRASIIRRTRSSARATSSPRVNSKSLTAATLRDLPSSTALRLLKCTTTPSNPTIPTAAGTPRHKPSQERVGSEGGPTEPPRPAPQAT
jgi:hypothetical protein